MSKFTRLSKKKKKKGASATTVERHYVLTMTTVRRIEHTYIDATVFQMPHELSLVHNKIKS